MNVADQHWQHFHDWEGIPGEDYYIGVKGDGFMDRAIAQNLSEENAKLIVDEHNRSIDARPAG